MEDEGAQSAAQISPKLDNASQDAKDENSAPGLDESAAENEGEQAMEEEDSKEPEERSGCRLEEMDETPPKKVAAEQARLVISFLLLLGSEIAYFFLFFACFLLIAGQLPR